MTDIMTPEASDRWSTTIHELQAFTNADDGGVCFHLDPDLPVVQTPGIKVTATAAGNDIHHAESGVVLVALNLSGDDIDSVRVLPAAGAGNGLEELDRAIEALRIAQTALRRALDR